MQVDTSDEVADRVRASADAVGGSDRTASATKVVASKDIERSKIMAGRNWVPSTTLSLEWGKIRAIYARVRDMTEVREGISEAST